MSDLRRAFEESFPGASFERNVRDKHYVNMITEAMWQGFQAHSKLVDAKPLCVPDAADRPM